MGPFLHCGPVGQGLKVGLLFACLILSSTRGRGNSKKTDSIHPLTLMTQTPPPLPKPAPWWKKRPTACRLQVCGVVESRPTHCPLITSFLHPLSPAQELQGPAVREMEMMSIRAECGPMCPLFLKERSPVGYLLAMKTEKPAMGPLGAYRLQRDKDRRRREKEQNCLTCNEL